MCHCVTDLSITMSTGVRLWTLHGQFINLTLRFFSGIFCLRVGSEFVGSGFVGSGFVGSGFVGSGFVV